MAFCRSSTLTKTPRRMRLPVNSPNHRSTKFSQLELVGTKCVMKRACRLSQQVYNWWNLFVRCAEPRRAREAITSRPLLLFSVGRLTQSGGQTTLHLTSNHAQAAQAQTLLTQLSLFLSGLTNAAEQLKPGEGWRRIWRRILEPYLQPATAMLGGSG